jgi:hypothetical protein
MHGISEYGSLTNKTKPQHTNQPVIPISSHENMHTKTKPRKESQVKVKTNPRKKFKETNHIRGFQKRPQRPEGVFLQ